jgi:protein pelota
LGSYHTLDLELFRNFTVEKEEWDDVSSGVVVEACGARKTSEVGAIVLQEGQFSRPVLKAKGGD